MRILAIAMLLSLPLVAGAQAFRCTDPATGRIVYTDQPCRGGEVVVPARTEAERLADELSAEQARARAAERQLQAQQDQRLRQEAARQEAAERAAAAQVPPSQTSQCKNAMAEADFRARSTTSTEEQVRTARFNAALACGQPPPAEVVVVQPQPWGVAPPAYRRPPGYSDGWGSGATGYPPGGVPPQRPQSSYGGGTQDNRAIPVAPVRPAAVATPRPPSGATGIAKPRQDDLLPTGPSGAPSR